MSRLPTRVVARRLPLLSSTVLLCTACATGGHFETEAVAPPTRINTWERALPKERDHVIDGGAFPDAGPQEYGFSAAEPYFVLTSLAPQALDLSRTTLDTQPDFDTLTYFPYPELGSTVTPQRISLKPDSWKARPDAIDYSEYVSGNADGHYSLVEHGGSVLKVAGFHYTRVGVAEIAGADKYARTLVNLFYKGSEKPEAMPVSGSATYDGYWERALETHHSATHNGYQGNLLQASTARFNVDFARRTLRGTLHGDNGERRQGYSLAATISGAGFNGTATPEHYSAIQEDATVSGGFFGPHAAELGGRIMGQQHRALGVFVARQTSADAIVQGEPIAYATLMQADGAEQRPAAGLFQGVHDLPFSGDLKTLRFNGAIFDLTQVAEQDGDICCTTPNFQFMQTGLLNASRGATGNPTLLYFAHGHLTPGNDLPVSGRASYKGSWIAFGRAPQGQAYIARSRDNEARFTADFAARTIAGSLQARSGADVIDVAATINGNRFAGHASIKTALTEDPQAVNLAREARITGTSALEGAFFGPQANEMAGRFINADQSFGGVFGAKQQIIELPASHTP